VRLITVLEEAVARVLLGLRATQMLAGAAVLGLLLLLTEQLLLMPVAAAVLNMVLAEAHL
jgi:hypothetical protein